MHGRRRATPRPVVVESSVQGEGVELVHRGIGIEIVFEFAFAVDGFEENAETVFRDEVTARAALDANAAIDMKTVLAVRPHIFERTLALPGYAFRGWVGPHAGRTKHVVPCRRDAERGNAEEVVLKGIAIRRGLGDVRVQRVVAGRSADVIHVRALALHLVEKNIRVRLNIRRFEAGAVTNRAQIGGVRDGDRAGVDETIGGRWDAPVASVANRYSRRRAGDCNGQVRVREPAPARIELQILHEREVVRVVESAGRRRREIMFAESEQLVLHQFGVDEEVGVARRNIQALKRQHIRARLEQTDPAREVELLKHQHIRRSPRRCRGGVPLRGSGSVAPRDLDAIEVGHQAVVIFHAQGQ